MAYIEEGVESSHVRGPNSERLHPSVASNGILEFREVADLKMPVSESEFLLEGTDFEFHCPRARILVREMPVGLRDRLGFEKIAVFQARL